jgi:integrase
MTQQLLTVAQLAKEWNCSVDFIYRRCRKGHPQPIPHTRLTRTDIRFDPKLIAGYLICRTPEDNLGAGSAVRGGCMTRNRIKEGTLLKRGRKRKLWLVQWAEGDRRPSHKLGWCDEMSKSQAKRAMRKFMETINSQREVAGESFTLESFFQQHYWNKETKEYGDELRTKRASTQRDMKNAVRQVILPRFGNRRMETIRTGEIQSYLISLIGPQEEGKVSRQTAMKYKVYLSSIFSAAIRLECGVIRNPVRSVKLTVKEPAKTEFVLDDLQTQQIAESLEDPRHKMMWNMNLWMGNRIGETRALRWNCIDWATGLVTVTESLFEGKSSRPKTKAGERAVLLNEAQIAQLKVYKQKHYPDAGPDEWLFPGKRNRPMDAGWFMAKVIKPVAEKLGFGAIHWHALRHWNNSAMLNSGIDPAIRMKRVGHATARTNLIYSHPDLALQKAASDAIWQRLELAKQKLEEKKKESESKAPISSLSVTLSVTPNQGMAANY